MNWTWRDENFTACAKMGNDETRYWDLESNNAQRVKTCLRDER